MTGNYRNQDKKAPVGKTVVITVRFTLEEAQQLKEACWREHKTVSQWIRERILGSHLPQVPQEVIDEILKRKYEINRIENNLNQLIMGHYLQPVMTDKEIQQHKNSLREIRRYLDELPRMLERRAVHGDYEVVPTEAVEERESGAASEAWT